jgi:hypothetical protein
MNDEVTRIDGVPDFRSGELRWSRVAARCGRVPGGERRGGHPHPRPPPGPRRAAQHRHTPAQQQAGHHAAQHTRQRSVLQGHRVREA